VVTVVVIMMIVMVMVFGGGDHQAAADVQPAACSLLVPARVQVGRRMTEAIALVPTNADDRLSQESLVTVLTCVLQPLVSHLEKGVAEFAESIMDLVGAVLDSRLETAMEEALR